MVASTFSRHALPVGHEYLFARLQRNCLSKAEATQCRKTFSAPAISQLSLLRAGFHPAAEGPARPASVFVSDGMERSQDRTKGGLQNGRAAREAASTPEPAYLRAQ